MADASKTEQPTQRRRQKAREKGQVARSKELSSALALAAVVSVIGWQGSEAITHWGGLYRNTLSLGLSDKIEPAGPLLFWASVEVFRWIVPIMCSAFVMALAGSLVQGGFVFSPEAMSLKFERFNPAEKFGQIFSLTTMSGVLKSLIPFSAIAYVGIYVIESHWVAMVQSSYMGMAAFFRFVGTVAVEVGWKCGLILFAWVGVDYFLAWRKIEGDLKMSQQELREEVKETDGNPQIKVRIRRIQRQMRRQQLLKATETATVVVTNPTHYAVALRYEENMEAPIVVAKGRDLIAQKIKEVARWSGVPIMENKPLAQALYKSVEVGQAIPSKLYTAVAEILVAVFRAQAEMRAETERRRAQNNPSGGGQKL